MECEGGVLFFFSSRRRHTRFDCDWSFRRVLFRSCCSAEFGAASGARHDLERFGVLPYGSLRQSDLIVIEGTITKKMAKRLRMIYDQMALPRYVIAMGDCAMSGGLFHDSYSIVNGAHEFVPVDVYVPGCPPRPEALEQAIIMLQEKIRRSKVYEQG